MDNCRQLSKWLCKTKKAAVIAPTWNCPSAPIENNPALEAKAKDKPVAINIEASISISAKWSLNSGPGSKPDA